MGGNSSYIDEWGVVPDSKRTHTDSGYKIDGHKVLLSRQNPEQVKNILNSNTPDVIYLIATRNKQTGEIRVQNVNIFVGHNLSCEINIVYDSVGNIVPFSQSRGTHCHFWQKDPSDGKLKRKTHDRGNIFSVSPEYNSLLEHIHHFNEQKNI